MPALAFGPSTDGNSADALFLLMKRVRMPRHHAHRRSSIAGACNTSPVHCIAYLVLRCEKLCMCQQIDSNFHINLQPQYLLDCNRMTAQRLLVKPWVGEAVMTVSAIHFGMMFASEVETIAFAQSKFSKSCVVKYGESLCTVIDERSHKLTIQTPVCRQVQTPCLAT